MIIWKTYSKSENSLHEKLFYILIMDEKVLVLCEKPLSEFWSNLYVLRPPESEKMVFTKVKMIWINSNSHDLIFNSDSQTNYWFLNINKYIFQQDVYFMFWFLKTLLKIKKSIFQAKYVWYEVSVGMQNRFLK